MRIRLKIAVHAVEGSCLAGCAERISFERWVSTNISRIFSVDGSCGSSIFRVADQGTTFSALSGASRHKWVETIQSIIITGSRKICWREPGMSDYAFFHLQTFCGSLAPAAGFPRDFFSRGSHWVAHVRTCACVSLS
jgi:hypothetical protein